MKQKLILSISLICLILSAGMFVYSVRYDDSEQAREYQKNISENYKIFAPPLPLELSFSNESVPLQRIDVREALDKEILKNTFWHSNTLLAIKRSYRYFPTIERILKENGIPDDFKYLAVIESGLENAVSPAGARGVWQFMKAAGNQYGLEINSEVDERYHLEKSTKAACKYLKTAYNKFGSWTLAAASYNMGMGGLNKRLKQQKVDAYYDLLLNAETARYVYRILAVKMILEKPANYGFYVREKDMYPPIKTQIIEVDTTINSWANFAIEHGLNYKLLKRFNPWLRKTKLTNKYKKTYKIRIPEQKALKIDYYFGETNTPSDSLKA